MFKICLRVKRKKERKKKKRLCAPPGNAVKAFSLNAVGDKEPEKRCVSLNAPGCLTCLERVF